MTLKSCWFLIVCVPTGMIVLNNLELSLDAVIDSRNSNSVTDILAYVWCVFSCQAFQKYEKVGICREGGCPTLIPGYIMSSQILALGALASSTFLQRLVVKRLKLSHCQSGDHEWWLHLGWLQLCWDWDCSFLSRLPF